MFRWITLIYEAWLASLGYRRPEGLAELGHLSSTEARVMSQ
jgi:hypothetical protein